MSQSNCQRSQSHRWTWSSSHCCSWATSRWSNSARWSTGLLRVVLVELVDIEVNQVLNYSYSARSQDCSKIWRSIPSTTSCSKIRDCRRVSETWYTLIVGYSTLCYISFYCHPELRATCVQRAPLTLMSESWHDSCIFVPYELSCRWLDRTFFMITLF